MRQRPCPSGSRQTFPRLALRGQATTSWGSQAPRPPPLTAPGRLPWPVLGWERLVPTEGNQGKRRAWGAGLTWEQERLHSATLGTARLR